MKTIIINVVLLFGVSISFSQVITIEEFFQTTMPSKTVIKTFSHGLKDAFYSSQHSRKILSVTNGRIKTFDTPTGIFEDEQPADIDLYDSKGKILTIPVEAQIRGIESFLTNNNRFAAYKQSEDNEFIYGIFEIDGSLVKSVKNIEVRASPGGEFYYTLATGDGSPGHIAIYDDSGNIKFRIPEVSEFQTEAPSDSQLIVQDHKFLSLWDINAMRKVWESNILREDYYTDTAFKISYSVKANIIVVRDMFGCHCFDFQGNFLWAQEGLGSNKRINMVGVSDEDGKLVVTALESNSIRVNIFSRIGILLKEIWIDIGNNCRYSGRWNSIADVFPEYILLRFMARVGEKKVHVTGILYYNDYDWIPLFVQGFWYLLEDEDESYTLIGFEQEDKEIIAFSIK